MKALENLVNKTFGNWTVIREAPEKQDTRDRRWECRCVCGNVSYVKTYHLTKGYSSQCVTCSHKPVRYTEELCDCVWNKIISNARKRNIKVKIKKEEAYNLFLNQNKRCALTGLLICFPENGTEERHRNYTASLDRVNSNEDYILDNVQWVHKDVNRMKNIFTQARFIEICRLVTNKMEG